MSNGLLPLVCRQHHEPAAEVISLRGMLDVATAAVLRSAFMKCLALDPPAVVVDVAMLRVGEPVALTVFPLLARTAAEWPGVETILCGAPREVVGELGRMAVLRHLPLCATLDGALQRAAVRGEPSQRAAERLPPVPDACLAGRRMVVSACRRWRLEYLTDLAQILVTELISNAVRHAGTSMEVMLARTGRYLHLAVRDGDPGLPQVGPAGTTYAPDGRGLRLVEALAASWGHLASPGGKIVWATLRTAR